MPNGGIDNCGECRFNNYIGNKSHGYCSIRSVEITLPFYTYCKNASTYSKIPDGLIYALGLSTQEQLYSRIPWFKNSEPRTCSNGTCHICGKSFEKGIEIDVENEGIMQFCSNESYLLWWWNQERGI